MNNEHNGWEAVYDAKDAALPAGSYYVTFNNVNRMQSTVDDRMWNTNADLLKDLKKITAPTLTDIIGPQLLAHRNSYQIVNVIFNDPATIVFWSDGTKTIVKAINEPYDPEKGLAMACAKKLFGNKGCYYKIFKKWLPKDNP